MNHMSNRYFGVTKPKKVIVVPQEKPDEPVKHVSAVDASSIQLNLTLAL